MRIAVFGAGGVGGYFGGRLAAAGHEVAFVARGAQLAALRRDGLRVLSALGDLHLRPVRATDDPAQIGPVEAVLFAVKLWDTAAAARAARPLLGPDTALVTFQNGVEAVATIGAEIGARHVLGGVAFILAALAAPGVVRHTGRAARLTFGEMDGKRTPRAERLAAALAGAGVETELSQDIGTAIWRKFIFLAPFSGATALTRSPIGPVREDPRTRALLRRAVEEAAAVAEASGVALGPGAVAATMAQLDGLPADAMASMLHDLLAGRRLELPWLSGAVARLGAAVGVPAPVHGFIAAALALHENGRPD